MHKEVLHHLEVYLKSLSDIMDREFNIYHILLNYGFKTVVSKDKLDRASYKPGVPRHCFYNALSLAARNNRHCKPNSKKMLYYCEGYAMQSDLLLPIHHAWCLRRDGLLVDTTWKNMAYTQPDRLIAYVGIVFKQEALQEFAGTTSKMISIFCQPRFLKAINNITDIQAFMSKYTINIVDVHGSC